MAGYLLLAITHTRFEKEKTRGKRAIVLDKWCLAFYVESQVRFPGTDTREIM
jgi:hypothetical protein